MTQDQAAGWTPYTLTTRNFREHSDNKIHSDDVARQYGFSGALVPGVAVYAHMVHPLVQRFGLEWLERSVTGLRLFKPAYDGDHLTITTDRGDTPDGLIVEIRNGEGLELARLDTSVPDPYPMVNALHARNPAAAGEMLPIGWDVVVPDQALRAYHWRPSHEDNTTWCDDTQDDLPIFREGDAPPLQPGLILQAANRVFAEHYTLGPWIHVSSHMTHHRAIRVGDDVEVRCVPLRKWERKGHHLVELYVVMLVDGLPAQEVLHEAIFQLRDREDAA